MTKFIFVLIILFLSATAVQAIECQSSFKKNDGYWRYRLIDDKKCWYKGKDLIPKSELHWKLKVKDVPLTRTIIATITEPYYSEQEPISFKERWNNTPAPMRTNRQFYNEVFSFTDQDSYFVSNTFKPEPENKTSFLIFFVPLAWFAIVGMMWRILHRIKINGMMPTPKAWLPKQLKMEPVI